MWSKLGLHPKLVTNLVNMGFTTPTEIQAAALPAAIQRGQDVIGVAETGSGKTLAFGLPLLHTLLSARGSVDKQQLAASGRPKKRQRKGAATARASDGPDSLPALVITPTRELGLQVKEHLVAAAKGTGLRVAAIVGGLAMPKQERLLKARPHVIIATPGRFWELVAEGHTYLSDLNKLKVRPCVLTLCCSTLRCPFPSSL